MLPGSIHNNDTILFEPYSVNRIQSVTSAPLHQPAQPRLSIDAAAMRWAEQMMEERAAALVAPLAVAREGADPEGIHDMRVASRRFAAAVRIFRDLFEQEEFESIRRAARRMLRRLGEMRDLDVLREYWAGVEPSLEEERQALAYLQRYLLEKEERIRPGVVKTLDRFQQGDFPRRVQAFFDTLPDEALDAGISFRQAAAEQLPCRLNDLLRYRDAVFIPEAETEHHEMRIAAKWLRYSMELFAPAFAGELGPQLKQVKALQEELGDLHDCDVRRDLVHGFLQQPLDWRLLERCDLWDPARVERGFQWLLREQQRLRRRLYGSYVKRWKGLEKQGAEPSWRALFASPDGQP